MTTTTTTKTASANQLLDTALLYAARGWHVIPLKPGISARRSPITAPTPAPGATQMPPAGKHLGWEARATIDPDRITRPGPRPVRVARSASASPPAHPGWWSSTSTSEARAGPVPDEWADHGATTGADVFAVLAERAGFALPVDTYATRTGRVGGTCTSPTRSVPNGSSPENPDG